MLSIMGFLGIVTSFTMRACLSIAITEMVVPLNTMEQRNDTLICPVDLSSTQSVNVTTIVSIHMTENERHSKILIHPSIQREAHDMTSRKSNKDGFFPHFSLDMSYHTFRVVFWLKNSVANGRY